MKRAVRITLQSLFFLVFLAGMGTLLYLSAQKRHRISCSELRVNIVDGEKFVTAQQIDAFILRAYGVCRGERIDSIGLDRIERLICSRDEVRSLGYGRRSAPRGCAAAHSGDAFQQKWRRLLC